MASVTPSILPRSLQWVDDLGTRSRGARFFRCALQVNPYAYLLRHAKVTAFTDETEYNAAIVAACQADDIEAIAVTDHYRVKTSKSLIAAASAAGIVAFPGFEAVSKDGVHFLCLFEPGTSLDVVDRRIGECGIAVEEEDSPTGNHDARELMRRCNEEWHALCIAAHVAAPGGLLRNASGQTRVKAWRSDHLLAVALPGPVEDAPDDIRPILQNKDANYRREPLPAVLNANDVTAPEDLAKPESSCEIKMSEVSLSGLRQAFLDPKSRLRISGDPGPTERTEIVGVHWDAGFLDGVTLPLNDNLNVLIGGRGAGKSTVVESLRYVLDLEPFGADAKQAHDGIVRQVLQSGTRVSVLVRSHHPATAEYVVERVVPNPPSVRSASTGELLDLVPADIAPRTEVFGQHEIAEFARSPEGRTRVLERFAERDDEITSRKRALVRDLEASRRKLLDADRDLVAMQERLDALPALEETLQRYKAAGVEKRLADRSLLVREEQVLATAAERLESYRDRLEELREELPVDRAFVSERALGELPGRETLKVLDEVLADLSTDLEAGARQQAAALARAAAGIEATREAWDVRRREVEAAYERILRELQKDQVDGAEFIRLRRQIEQLQPLQEKRKAVEKSRKSQDHRRRELLVEWEALKAEEFRKLDRAAKKVSRQLQGRVWVQVRHGADRQPLLALLKEQVGGRLSEACNRLEGLSQLSLTELAEAIRAGGPELQRRFGVQLGQAQRIAAAGPELAMRVEELELASRTEIKLNVAAGKEDERWQAIDELSAGQKATAILLLVLLESDAPLIVDQPEDDLDNRFIADGVVPRMRDEKRRRQFVFSTHNANIPVLGDAELIAGLTANDDRGEISSGHLGSIDVNSVRELVEELLEGGHEAFEERRRKYGF